MSEPLFSAKCNCLFPTSNVKVDGVVGKTLATNTKSAVQRHGNWVGGTVKCFDDRVVFSMNAINAKFQQDNADLVVPYADMSAPRFGSMMWLFKTVDVDTVGGLMRFRCAGKSSQRLVDLLKSKLG